MSVSSSVTVKIDLQKIQSNVADIARRTNVDLIAVVKADAYGLGGRQVAESIADLVEAFYVFDAAEAVEYELQARTGKRTICLLGESNDPADYRSHKINPAVWDNERALALSKAQPVLCIDTGQQRFACPPDQISQVLKSGDIHEAFTHASTFEQTRTFDTATANFNLHRHAAGSSLFDHPQARFDAVRPGLAMYRGAARVSARLIEARNGTGPAGYTGFITPRHGVIRSGYSNGMHTGICLINGERRKVLEVGMQTAFVELSPRDKIGDEVILLGDGLTETEVTSHWNCTPQEALQRLCTSGIRSYL